MEVTMVKGVLARSAKWIMLLALPLLVLGGFSQAGAEGFKAAIVMPGVITDKSFN